VIDVKNEDTTPILLLLTEVFEATPHLIKFSKNKLWVDYDEEADVLYFSFQRPQKATESEMRDDGVLLRYKRDKLVGIRYWKHQKDSILIECNPN
jgi:uncharacterized protein YuzE